MTISPWGRAHRQQRSPGLLDLELEGERYLDDSWNVVESFQSGTHHR